MSEEYKLIEKYASDILNSKSVLSQKEFMQHGKVSVYDHTINVTIHALKIVKKFKIKVDERSLIRGCLLHDYFLYDWHDNDKSHRLHGFRHAKFAYNNATKEYDLNKVEKNMILTHMFPLNLRLPRYKESIILCIADKIVATKETIGVMNRLEIIEEEI